jgi:hypothetical protein
MAFASNNLSVLAYANGFTLWHYRTTDANTTVDTTGYFNAAINMLRVGDMILSNSGASGSVNNGVYVVITNDGTNVDVANMTNFAPANSD